jgi:hypothetical protein
LGVGIGSLVAGGGGPPFSGVTVGTGNGVSVGRAVAVGTGDGGMVAGVGSGAGGVDISSAATQPDRPSGRQQISSQTRFSSRFR